NCKIEIGYRSGDFSRIAQNEKQGNNCAANSQGHQSRATEECSDCRLRFDWTTSSSPAPYRVQEVRTRERRTGRDNDSERRLPDQWTCKAVRFRDQTVGCDP